MDEATNVASRGPVPEGQSHLLDPETRARRIDRHPHLAAEAGRERKRRGANAGGERALTGERLALLDPRAQADDRARSSLRDAESPTLPLLERGDDEIAAAVEERDEVPFELRVAEEQPAGRSRALRRRERLAFAEAWEPKHGCARRLCRVCSSVARAVIADDHLGIRECGAQ